MDQPQTADYIVAYLSIGLLLLFGLSRLWGWMYARSRPKSYAPRTAPASSTYHNVAPAQAAGTEIAPSIIRLNQIADADNILVIGPKGSGKTTLLKQLIAIRSGALCALDPHNAPDKWPCEVVGGGRDFAGVDTYLQAAYSDLNRRYTAMHEGRIAEGQFGRLTLVGDEWRAIAQELPGERGGRLGAGAVLLKLLAEGRKVALCVLAASHNDTAASMGMAGDMAMLSCFDWTIYLGALAVRKLPAAGQMQRPAVAYHAERDTFYLLDIPAYVAPAAPAQGRYSYNRPAALSAASAASRPLEYTAGRPAAGLENRPAAVVNWPEKSPALETDFSALESDFTISNLSFSAVEIAQITALIVRGNGKTEVVKAMPRYTGRKHSEYAAAYDQLRAAVEAAPAD
jgi:hypothetical protein